MSQLDRIEGMLVRTLELQILSINGERKIMALSQQTLDIVAALNTETSAIAAELDALRSAKSNDAEIQAALAPLVARLHVLASDPSNPVPAPVAP